MSIIRFFLYLLLGTTLSIQYGSAQSCNQNIALKWSSFQGGNGHDEIVDLYESPSDGKIYTIATTTSTNLIVTNSDLGLGGADKTYVQCMNPDGTLSWSTLISGWKTPHNIYVDDTGNVILFGHTVHSNLPMLGNGLDKTLDGASDMVYFKLNPAGSSIISSSYIGGDGYECIKGLNTNIDFHQNRIYGVVSTSSTDISPSANALSSVVGQAYIFCYDFASELFAYQSYYEYSSPASSVGFELDPGTEALVVDNSGNLCLVLSNLGATSSLTSHYITSNALISNYPNSPYNFPPLLIVLSGTFDQEYGTYISNIIDNPGTSGSGVLNVVPGIKHDFSGFDVEVDGSNNIYFLQNGHGFRTRYYTLSGGLALPLQTPLEIGPSPYFNIISTGTTQYYQIQSNIIKLGRVSNFDFNVEYVHHLAYGHSHDHSNVLKFKIDKYNRVNLLRTSNPSYGITYLGTQSLKYSEAFATASEVMAYTIFDESSDKVVYHLQPGNDVLTPNWTDTRSRIYDLTILNNGVAIFGRSLLNTYPVTFSYRDQAQNTQVFTQQPIFGGGDSDGFLTVLHTPLPYSGNTIADFPSSGNTFCTDSYIHQNYGPVQGAAISWQSGDGSQVDHLVPDFQKGNVTHSHPLPLGFNFIQWQKSYDNLTWSDIPGAVQEDLNPVPETSVGTVHYRRLFRSCSDTVSSNVIDAMISGVNDMQVDVGASPYYHCTGSATAINISVVGGSGDFSWQWYNGYATSVDIVPSSGSSSTGITANVSSSVNGGGVYRIVISDNQTGCEQEAFITVRDPSISLEQQHYLCPGEPCITIGPAFSDPANSYQWLGPNGFTSTSASICVNDPGQYSLTLNSCPSTTVSTHLILSPHDPALTTIPNYNFCQFDSPVSIGMSTNAPAGYTFQWAPTQNISDITAFTPIYNPTQTFIGNTQEYTFTAIRDIDGCVYEEDLDISIDEAVSVNMIQNTGFCDGSDNLYLSGFTGSYVEWEITATTFPGGLSALVADPDFSFDGLSQSTAASLNPVITYPQLVNTVYDITVEVRGSSIPFPNACFDTDQLDITIYESCTHTTGCTSCPPASCGHSVSAFIPPGTDGICSGTDQEVVVGPSNSSNTYQWTIIGINDVTVSGVALEGIFDINGNLLPTSGPHPNRVIFDIDNPTPAANSSITYELTTTSVTGLMCTDTLKVYSSAVYGPIVDMIEDTTACSIGSSVLVSGTALPLTVDGTFYNSAPNSTIDWQWSGPAQIVNGDTPFPTLTHANTTTYTIKGTDILSGCTDSDQLVVNIENVSGGAGVDVTNVCSQSTIQIPGPLPHPTASYVWTPPAGLNFPIGTPNNMVPSPFATVDQDITYTLTTTLTTCVTEDQMDIITSVDTPPDFQDQTYQACLGDQVDIQLNSVDLSDCVGCIYSWSHVIGGSINYLNSTTVAEPIVSIPSTQATSLVTFQLEITKGSCGTDIMLVNIMVALAPAPQIPSMLNHDCSLPLQSISIGNYNPTVDYYWAPVTGLYEDANMSVPLQSGPSQLGQVYVYAPSSQVYTVYSAESGCISPSSTVEVINTNPLQALAGPDKSLCPLTTSVDIGDPSAIYPGSATFSWTPSGISLDPYASTFTMPSTSEAANMISWLSAPTSQATIFQQNSTSLGSYEYTLSVNDGNCVVTDQVVVRVVSSNFPMNFAGVSEDRCIDDCFYLLSSPDPDYSYHWSVFPASELGNMTFPYSNNPLVCPQVDATYSVYLTDLVTGCTSESESVTYSLYPSPSINDQIVEICQFDILYDLTSYVPGYSSLLNPTWELNDGSGVIVSSPSSYLISSNVEFILTGENQFGCSDDAIISFENPSTSLSVDRFHKIIGSSEAEASKQIRFIGADVYLSYTTVHNGLQKAALAKYDRSGTLLWSTTLNYTSQLNDFVEDEDCNILAVGYRGAFNTSTNNESLLVRFDSGSGSVISSRTVQNPGREEFKKIIRSDSPTNPTYYISGTRNPNSTPSSVDMTSLYHYSLNGSFLFEKFYTEGLGQLDEEGDRGIIQLPNGNVLLMGNDGPTGRGLIIQLHGSTGTEINTVYTDAIIDFYDAALTESDEVLIVGERFNDDQGVLVVLDQSLGMVNSFKFPTLTDFRQIIKTGTDTYTIAGRSKTGDGEPVVFSVTYSQGILTATDGYMIDGNEISYHEFWFDYDELNDVYAYSDTRVGNPNGFGDMDILLGVFGPQLTTICTQSFSPVPVQDNVVLSPGVFSDYSFIFQTSTAFATLPLPMQESTRVCGCDDNALNLDGIDDYASGSSVSLSTDFSISGWFRTDLPSNGGTEDRILSFGPTNRLEFGIQESGPGQGEFWFYDQASGVYESGVFVRDGLWHHFVYTRNVLDWTLYVDGTSALTGSSIATGPGYYGPSMSLGRWTGGSGATWFKGDIDEVSVWNITLGQAEVDELYSCKLVGAEIGLLAYYSFDQGLSGSDNSTITSLVDNSGMSNDLVLTGFALDGSTSNFVCSDIGVSGGCDICLSPPLALCSSGLSFSIDNLGDVVTVTTSDIDNGSYAQCGSQVLLSFDQAGTQTSLTYDCTESPGVKTVDLWVTDANGNQSSCMSTYTLSNTTVYPILSEFYHSTDGPNWTSTQANDRPWLQDCDPCGTVSGLAWKGIACDANDQVTTVFLPGNGLSGTLPSSLSQLTQLVWIDVSNNQLFGPLPDVCGMSLLYFDVASNFNATANQSLTGQIPICFETMYSLIEVDMSNNSFDGALVDLGENHIQLEDLRLDDNQFTGTIPGSYGSIPLLNDLELNDNNLSGCYPQELTGLCLNANLIVSNAEISDGNSSLTSWEDFCLTGANKCCPDPLVIDWSPLLPGVYRSGGNIDLLTPLLLQGPVTLSHGTNSSATIPQALQNNTNLTVTNNGCN